MGAAALKEAEATEAEAIKTYEALMAAKQKEVETLNAMIEEKLTRKGELGVELAGGLNELEDTKIALAEDEKFLAELETGCATKEKEWAEVCKTRQEELVALAETIKILNDDDALELFKKNLAICCKSFAGCGECAVCPQASVVGHQGSYESQQALGCATTT